MTPALATLTKSLPGHWTEHGKHLICVRYSQRSRGWLASVNDGHIYGQGKRKHLSNGRTALGIWPTREAATQAGRDFLAMEGVPRIATVRDIVGVRKMMREQERKALNAQT